MRLYLSIIFLVAIVFSSCKKEEEEQQTHKVPDIENQTTPEKVQWGFALYYTATWWGYCGDWGGPLIHEFAAAGKVVAIAAHASNDPMYDANLYKSFTDVRSTGGAIPSFWVGDIKTYQPESMTELLNQIPIAGIGITFTKSETNIKVNTNVKFYEDATGEYYLSVLILESGIDGSSSAGAYAQSGTANPSSYQHDFVLRASSVEGNAYGELIIENPDEGENIENEYVIQLNSSWTKTVYPVAILWKKDIATSPNYKFINAAS